ncbi:xin actin-binding repeat-containing protein 2 isoform X2 [Gadus morhua]|uniref:xin actin-binding repeat-containing protein 2 isoform X2 n=1 Tax=Gadus morhua TaxID=8049 RepID=UPI0011B37CE6|nr:xin actin-binding repeat-containing protein 2-like isoform X2 [Gadus morhua]
MSRGYLMCVVVCHLVLGQRERERKSVCSSKDCHCCPCSLKINYKKLLQGIYLEVRDVQPSPPQRGLTSPSRFDQRADLSNNKMASVSPETSAGSVSAGLKNGSGPQRSDQQEPQDPDGEPLSVKERLAMYQAALKKETGAATSCVAVMEESEACSLPGGLASVKRQFESQQFASSSSSSSHSHSTVTQHQYQQRSVQAMSASSETLVRSSDVNQTSSFQNQQEVTRQQHHAVQQDSVAAGYGSHYNETVTVVGGEDLPAFSTHALKTQYEKTIEEATPSKQVKIDVDLNDFQWEPVNRHASKSAAATSYQSSSNFASSNLASSNFASSSSALAYEAVDPFPPPPTEQELPDYCQACSHHSQSQVTDQRSSEHKEHYFKHKSMAELKRLYKHIHPDVRKTLEADFLSQLTEEERVRFESEGGERVEGEVQQTCYLFENDGGSPNRGSSPEGDYLEWEEILKGEVQSMRRMFENKPLDAIKDDTLDEREDNNISQQEIIAGKDVRYTAWMFENQPMDALGTETGETTSQVKELARGDVRTATWLFETQPMDYMNKIYQEQDEQVIEVVIDKDISGGDVKTARYLFETQHLDSLGKTETIDESNFLNLKSELEEIKGEVKTTTCMFETQPMCVIRGDSGEMLEITKIRREETEKGDVKTSRWMFETQALDMIHKDPSKVKLICGVSMEDDVQGGVNKGKWLFETKTLDAIKEEDWECSKREREEIIGADVRQHCRVFETQRMDTLKDNANARPACAEEIVGGDVRSAKHLFETVPMENLKDLLEVGKLQKRVASEEEKGDVRHQKWMFESQPLENIRAEKREITRTVNMEALDKGDVTNYKERFETMDLSRCEGTQRIQVEGVTSGSVRSNKVLFESTPMYAMQDSAGHYHEVKTVRREEVVKGDVRSCRWMFETRPIDEFDESIDKFQIIKGISKQEIQSGDVKTAKWLFETQALDAIKYEHEERQAKEDVEIEKGDVKTCRWLFETQPMDGLYEKEERSETDVQQVQKGDVKTCTWLFETQTLDNIRDHAETESETILKTCTINQEDIQGKDVGRARFLFETENLDCLTGEDSSSFRRVTEIDIDSGDVSRMKYIFENSSSDIMTSTSGEVMQRLKTKTAEDIQRGNVINNTRMFENQAIDTIKEDETTTRELRTVTDVQGGNVDKGRFIFETYSLDQIQDENTETDISKLIGMSSEEIQKGDVKNYTMMFETQPLYAIRDKDGHYHEVTTVTKEEVMRGDVKGARWQFETKPLDSIRDSEEVYVIKAVTEEGVNKGDVSSARWRFETQPLDEIAEDMKVRSKTVEDVQGGDVKSNTQRFETDEMSQKYVRTVSVSEIQKGDVRSATWMFETRTMDKIHSENTELSSMETVTKKDVVKGDVTQSVWLFEKQPLDKIREKGDDDEADRVITKEAIPQADVKSTTWLFESTPVHEFNESSTERSAVTGKSIKETLEELYCQKMVDSQGILIEADEIGDVRMAKYKLMNQNSPEIQREEIIRGDLNNIMMNLLNRSDGAGRGITVDVEERGNINTTVRQLFSQEKGASVEKEAIVRGDIQEAINNLLKQEGSSKRGLLIQEDEKGDVRMTIYSLLNKAESDSVEREDVVQGNVSKTLHRLMSNPDAEKKKKIKVGETERGNVSFYSTCIESGALDYLRNLRGEPDDEPERKTEKERIVGGDVEETKLILRRNQQQVGRTVAEGDIVAGDVHSNVQVFMTEPSVNYRNLEKQDIVKGDLWAAMDSLTQAANQRVVMEREEVVKGDLSTTLKSLHEARYQAKDVEKPDIIRGDIRGALQSLEKSATARTEATVEDLVPGDIKGTLRSLEEAKQAVKEVEKEEIVKGDIYTAMQNLHEVSSERKLYQHQASEQGDIKGTIQLLLEPPDSPRMQRRRSIEGDVKTSIKTLYEGQEMTQTEKEEVIKGDVQGAIKNLMQKKQYANPKRMYSSKRVKVTARAPEHRVLEHTCVHGHKSMSVTAQGTPAVTNLPQAAETQRHTQKPAESQSVNTKAVIQEESSHTVTIAAATSESSKRISSKEESVTQNGPPQTQTQPQPKPQAQIVPAKPVSVKSKPTPHSQQTEMKSVVDMNVKQGAVQSVSTKQTNVSTKKTQETRTVKQVHTTVIEQQATSSMSSSSSSSATQGRAVSEHVSTSQRQSAVMENKGLAQKQDIKSAKGEYRNLENKAKGLIKKKKPEINFPPPPSSPPPPSESELSLPSPPSPVTEGPGSTGSRPPIMRQDSDLPPPPPPPPPPAEPEAEFFPPPPPPPPPPTSADFLPPLPSQLELDALPQPPPPTKPGKPAPRPLFKIPKPMEPVKPPAQPKPKWQKKQPIPAPPPPPPTPPPPPPQPATEQPAFVTEQPATVMTRVEETRVQQVQTETTHPTETRKQTHTQSTESTAAPKALSGIPVAKSFEKEPLQPPKKRFVPPLKLHQTPETSEAPKPRPYARKFKTPLMLAEERFRLQREKEEMENLKPTPPNSPPAHSEAPPTGERFLAGNAGEAETLTTQSMQSTEAMVEERRAVAVEETSAHDAPVAKKLQSHIPSSKPLIAPLKKKSQQASSNITLDNKQGSRGHSSVVSGQRAQSSSDVFRESQTTQVSVSTANSPPSPKPVDITTQSGAGFVSGAVTEQKQFMKKSSTVKCVSATKSSVQESVNVQSQPEVTLRAEEETKAVNVADTQEGRKGTAQPTKIPKVAPSFKVKTFKMPPEMKDVKCDSLAMKQAVTGGTQSHLDMADISQRNETTVMQENSLATSAALRNEVEVKMDLKAQVAKRQMSPLPRPKPSHKSAEHSVTKQTAKRENEEKHAGAVHVVSMTETEAALGPQAPGYEAVSSSHHSSKTEHRREVVVTQSVTQQSIQRQAAVSVHTQKTKSSQQQQQQQQHQQHQQTSATTTSKVQGVNVQSMTAKSEAGDTEMKVSAESMEMDRCRLVQLLAHIKALQGGAGKIDSDAVRGIVSEVPDWMMGVDEKRNLSEIALHQSKKKLKEMTAYMRNMAEAKLTFLEAESRAAAEHQGRGTPSAQTPPPPPPPTSKKPDTKAPIGGPSAKTSKVTVAPSVVESRREAVEERRITSQHHGVSKTQELTREGVDHRGSSMMTVRTPSPTFITIESVRRTDSPRHGVTPSPPPYRAVGTPPPPPPPRRPYAAQSPLLNRATPSPTLSRSEKVVQLKTPRGGTTPTPPPPPPRPIVEEVMAEQEGSPGFSFVASYTVSEEEGPGVEVDLEGCAEEGDSMMTVRDKKSFFEEAHRAEVTKVYTRKDPIEIPERLGADAEEPHLTMVSPEGLPPRVDLSKLVNRFETPQQPPAFPRKEPIVITERLGSDTEEDAEAEPKTPRSEDVPAFNVRALKDVFETGEHGSQAARDLREHIERRESESEPRGHSETSTTTTVAELFSGMDDFGGSRCSETHATVQCSASSSVAVVASGRGSPPSYADVVRGATEILSEAAEEMLRNYQQSWAESQEALQSAGVMVTEQRSSQSVTRHHHQQQTVATENQGSRLGAVRGMPEEGVPHGGADRRQTNVP